MSLSVCVSVFVCTSVCARARACVRASVCVCVCMCDSVCVSVWMDAFCGRCFVLSECHPPSPTPGVVKVQRHQ